MFAKPVILNYHFKITIVSGVVKISPPIPITADIALVHRRHLISVFALLSMSPAKKSKYVTSNTVSNRNLPERSRHCWQMSLWIMALSALTP